MEGFGGKFASWRRVVYGVSSAAAAAIASSPSEFLGVMRSGSIEVLFGLVVGFCCRPGTGLRRRGMFRCILGGEDYYSRSET